MLQLHCQDCICWRIFLFILKRDAINIYNLILWKSICHNFTLQATQASQRIPCPYDAANKVCLKPKGFHSNSY